MHDCPFQKNIILEDRVLEMHPVEVFRRRGGPPWRPAVAALGVHKEPFQAGMKPKVPGQVFFTARRSVERKRTSCSRVRWETKIQDSQVSVGIRHPSFSTQARRKAGSSIPLPF